MLWYFQFLHQHQWVLKVVVLVQVDILVFLASLLLHLHSPLLPYWHFHLDSTILFDLEEEYVKHDEPKRIEFLTKTFNQLFFPLTHPFNSSSSNSDNGAPVKSSLS
jgi:hypothetical protein